MARRSHRAGEFLTLFLLGSCIAGFLFVSGNPQKQAAAPEKAKSSLAEAQAQAVPEKIIPGPRNIKERIAIFVFIGWLWAAILVLVYILRLVIREADRIYKLKLYSGEKK